MSIISHLLQPTKGILAADESSKTIQKRFDKIGLNSTPETNLAYRKMLFTTPGIEEYISGVILYDETIRQSIDGIPVPKYLEKKDILIGIKVDQGTKEMDTSPNEKVTEGLDGLEQRLKEYSQMGAKFAKWRAVIIIGEGLPTDLCIAENAERLAKYAYFCQQQNIVPIVEPEVLMDGSHDLQKCKEVTSKILKTVFARLLAEGVVLEGIILKPNMVISGKDALTQATPKQIAEATTATFQEVVPKEVPGIVFLSGGQTPDEATQNLYEINLIGGPWQLSFSYGRALQDEALKAWARSDSSETRRVGKEENIPAAQKAFFERAQKVSLARQGKLI